MHRYTTTQREDLTFVRYLAAKEWTVGRRRTTEEEQSRDIGDSTSKATTNWRQVVKLKVAVSNTTDGRCLSGWRVGADDDLVPENSHLPHCPVAPLRLNIVSLVSFSPLTIFIHQCMANDMITSIEKEYEKNIETNLRKTKSTHIKQTCFFILFCVFMLKCCLIGVINK